MISFSPLVGDFLVRGSNLIVYHKVGDMVLNAGNHNNKITVRAIAGPTTTINAGNGTNQIAVGDAVGGNRILIAQPLTIHGQKGTNVLAINDQGTSSSETYTLTAGGLIRTGAAPISFDAIRTLRIRGGSGNNTFAVLNTAASPYPLATTLYTGSGTDMVNVLATTGPLNVISGGPTTANVGNGLNGVQDITGALTVTNPPSFTQLNLNDSADTVGRNVTLSLNPLTGFGTIAGLAPALIRYQPMDLSALNITAGSGGNSPGCAPATKIRGKPKMQCLPATSWEQLRRLLELDFDHLINVCQYFRTRCLSMKSP